MSEPGKAVFLSYASQDAEAAKKICDALRAAGVEVWFDQSELVGGDQWDQKIRKQIRECMLLIPVISRTTQARREAYFRLEWKLADERTHLMAKGTPFLLPVTIDETSDRDALVPDSFLTVQWTRLPGGETPVAFCALVKKMLGGSNEAGRGLPTPPPNAAAALSGDPAVQRKRTAWRGPAIAGAALLIAVAAYVALRPIPSAPPSPGAGAKQPAVSAGAATFPRDGELRRAWNLLLTVINAEDLSLAEDIVKSAVARQPADPETVIVYAWLNNQYLNRGFDVSEERYVLGKRYAERAVQLAPAAPEALAALGQFLSFRNADLARAEQLLRRAIELNPREPRFHRALTYNVVRHTRPAEGLQLAERAAGLFPDDALTHYELGLHYRDAGRIDDMERALDRCLALAPISAAMIWKCWIAGWVHGDVAGMKHWLDRLPADSRLTDRVIIVRYQFAVLSRQPAELADALRALQAFPGAALRDFYYTGPKALLIGDLYAAQGKGELAKGQYEVALAEIARSKVSAPADFNVLTAEIWTLLGLGRREEALAAVRLVLGSVPQNYQRKFVLWWFEVEPAGLLLGARELALKEMKPMTASAAMRSQLRTALRIDPRMAPFRDDPEIAALLAEPKQETVTTGSAPVIPSPSTLLPGPSRSSESDKSVAVLAFANLSDDKANEYFSDGVSEELLNVLAKIPGLKVSARTSAFYFKGKEVPIPEIAQKLGVAYVVEGSVRKAGDKVRITAQLIKAADGFHVWSDTFTRDLKDIFAVQDEIAGIVAKNLSVQLGMGAGGRRREVAPAAYEEFLTGRALATVGSVAAMRESIARFRRAVEIDPEFTTAWTQIARSYVHLSRWGGLLTADEWSETRRAMTRAEALEPASPDVQLALGWVRRTADWNWKGAELAMREALRLRPDHAETLAGLGVLLANLGREQEAIAAAQRAAALDPLNSSVQMDLLVIFYCYGRFPEAVQAGQLAAQLAPGSSIVRSWLARSLIELNRFDEAEAEINQEDNWFSRTGALARLRAKQGRLEEARALLYEMEARAEELGGTENSYAYLANVWGIVGDAKRGLDYLEKTRAIHDPSIAWARTSFYEGHLRSDPRWPDFLRSVGLADEQLK